MADAAAALVAAQAPIDLTSLVSRFVLEELNHSELAARVVVELGGGPTLAFDPSPFYPPPDSALRPIMRAAYYVMRIFCTGETYSLPVVRAATRLSADVPLLGAVLARIAKDEAAHASFGWIFFDWAKDLFTEDELEQVRELARAGVKEIDDIVAGCGDEDEPTLGWLPQATLKRVLARASADDVVAPLRARGLYAG
jgi:hypothetical protein